MNFYINTISHEVHKEYCAWKPNIHSAYLGSFDTAKQAIAAAIKNGYSNADGCAHCSPEAHTK